MNNSMYFEEMFHESLMNKKIFVLGTSKRWNGGGLFGHLQARIQQ